MRCSIVVRAFNEELHIGRLLEGILDQSLERPEIVVVDSGSTDATLEIVGRYPAKIVAISPSEFSFGRSLNRGLAVTTSPFVALASAHVYPEFDDWLERLLEPFANPDVALTYGRQRGDGRTKFSEHRIFEQWFPAHRPEDQRHPFCNNANAAIRRQFWEQTPYDESLTGLEDIAWARRMLEAGRRIVYVPEAVVVHVHEESPTRIFRRYQREAVALRRIDPDAHFGFGEFVRLFSRSVQHDFGAARRERSLARNLTSIVGFRLLQYWGTYRGFARRAPVTSELTKRFYYPPGGMAGTVTDRESARRLEYEKLDERSVRHD